MIVSDSEFEIASSNLDNKKIINSVLKKYSKNLDYDELNECKLYGLWKSLLFCKKKEIKCKFTTILYMYINWECQIALKGKIKNKSYQINDSIIDSNKINIFEIFDGISKDEQDIMNKKFFHKMTLIEIGKELGVSKDTVCSRISKILAKLR